MFLLCWQTTRHLLQHWQLWIGWDLPIACAHATIQCVKRDTLQCQLILSCSVCPATLFVSILLLLGLGPSIFVRIHTNFCAGALFQNFSCLCTVVLSMRAKTNNYVTLWIINRVNVICSCAGHVTLPRVSVKGILEHDTITRKQGHPVAISVY